MLLDPRLPILLVALAPDWVRSGGTSGKYPSGTHLLGFAVLDKAGADGEAKTAAANDLASRISVRIENQMTDVQAEKDGQQSYAVATMTKASTDVRLSGLTYETYQQDGKTYALAILDRATAAPAYKNERDLALKKAEGLAGQNTLKALFEARLALADAMEKDGITRVLQPDGNKDFTTQVAALTTKIDFSINALLKKPVATFADLGEVLAFQLNQQGVGKGDHFTVAAPSFGTTTFSSPFGRQLAIDLERQLLTQGGGKSRELAIKGSYLVEADMVRVLMMVREAKSGAGVASAEASVPKKALSPELAPVPQNFTQAMIDQKMLGKNEEVSGSLRLELFTNKGKQNLVFANKEDLKILMRVNKPAYVQIVYMLANGGLKVPISQGYFIDESKVNLLVEFPDTFTVSAPFGVERIFAVAYTEKPEPLPTKKVKVDGEDYDVVTDAPTTLVKHRGIQKKAATKEIAESWVTLTTTAR